MLKSGLIKFLRKFEFLRIIEIHISKDQSRMFCRIVKQRLISDLLKVVRENAGYDGASNTTCRLLLILRRVNRGLDRIVDYYACQALRNIKLSFDNICTVVNSNLIYILRVFIICIPDFVNRVFGGDDVTLLMIACICNNVRVVSMLLTCPSLNVNARDEDGWTALIYACGWGRADIIRLLLYDPRMNINAQDKDGWTALMHACSCNHTEIVRLLLEDSLSLNVNLKDKYGRPAVYIARYYGNIDIVELIEDYKKEE